MEREDCATSHFFIGHLHLLTEGPDEQEDCVNSRAGQKSRGNFAQSFPS